MLQTIHYLYRAILAPLFLNPSMSPIHLSVWLSAFSFQVINGTCIGGWVAGYGTPSSGWFGFAPRFTLELGMMIWFFGFIGNIYHDDELREIRRAAARNQKRRQAAEDSKDGKSKTVDKVYMVPQNGLFRAILYPHYLCEWVEWLGFWIIGGQHCIPAKNFVLAEVSTMTPRALSGKRWYITRFGKDKIGNRKAVIPGIL
jgi:3-oxo-5-alpha-steroid 4-dehydrogenase 1